MKAGKRFAVVGSDARQAAAGRALERAGYAVSGAEQVALADYILLPLPLDESRTPLAELLRAAKPGALALGGRLSVQAKVIAREAGVELIDYFARPELTVYNAIPTAEGCIGILLAERTRTLWGENLLLLGFGPVGQALGARLAALGADALAEAVERLHDGTVVRLPQDHSAYTYAPMLDRSLSPLDFSKSARQLHDQVRGLIPWPCASMTLDGKNVKVYRTAVGGKTALAAGKIAEAGKQGLAIACGDGLLLRILELQAEGGKRMSAAAYLLGHPMNI